MAKGRRERECKMTSEMVGGGDHYLTHDPPHSRPRSGTYPPVIGRYLPIPSGGQLVSPDTLGGTFNVRELTH